MPVSDYVMPEGVPPMLRDAYMAKMVELGTTEGATPGNRSNLAAIKSSIANWETESKLPPLAPFYAKGEQPLVGDSWAQTPATEDDRLYRDTQDMTLEEQQADLNNYDGIDWEGQAPLDTGETTPAKTREINADDKPSEHFISATAGNFNPDVNYETRPDVPAPVAPQGRMVSQVHTSAPRPRLSSSQAPVRPVTQTGPTPQQQQQQVAQAMQMREAYNRRREDYFNPFGPQSEYSDLQRQRTR